VAKKKPTAPLKIPFYKTGGLAQEALEGSSAFNWRENFEFDALLVMTGFDRGRIGVIRAVFVDEAGNRYPMFVADLTELLTESGLIGGRVQARWSFVKRGARFYGIRRVPGSSTLHPALAALALHMLSGDRAAAAAFVDRAVEAVQSLH
jgi:hypothetical protein